MDLKPEAKDLPCVFASFAEFYPTSDLLKHIGKCKPEEQQHWRNASASASVKKLMEIAKRIGRKKLKLSTGEEPFKDFGSQVSFPDPTCEILQKRIDELESLNSQLLIENEVLKKKLNERFINQQDRISSVIEIAKKERNEIHEELTNYLSIILEELILEKNQKTNTIDDLVNSQSQTGSMKKCTFCQASDIDNRKRICPICHNKLPTISEMNQQSNELPTIKNTTNKSLVICPYSDTQEPRTRPSFAAESSRYWAQIRKTQFMNPKSNIPKLINKMVLDIWYLIPITCEEADLQKNESSLTKSQILSIINSLTPSLGLSNKSRNDLINILQEIRSVLAENNINIDSKE
ncbi:30866_t:CDS:2 [Gigaspora margarita]|uniref:30866_t:CDS:1 n=1 Tax=Gigaspora margarita TaxID=4874 RepID=A0ABN7VVV9_GIGMA|nr:30866_t:CDS:2 [Gigaspora margarita]